MRLSAALLLVAIPFLAAAQNEGEEDEDFEQPAAAPDSGGAEKQGPGASAAARRGNSGSNPQVTSAQTVIGAQPPLPQTVLQTRLVENAVIERGGSTLETMGCPARDVDLERVYVICAVVSGDRFSTVAVFPETHAVLMPNRSIVVMVLHPNDRQIGIATVGAFGIYTPKVNSALVSRSGTEPPPKPRWVVSSRTFPPLLPGKAKVHLGLAPPDGKKEMDSVDLEFLIQEAYSGAVRVGIAAVGWEARNQTYQLEPIPESDGLAKISPLPQSQADFEIVLGYAPYLETGGRGQLGCTNRIQCLAPYIGLGMVAPKGDSIEFLTSFHLGIDYEIAPNFSVAATLVARRVDRLRPGLSNGQEVPEGTSLTHKQFGFGAAIIFNVGPEFLKTAAGGASALLK